MGIAAVAVVGLTVDYGRPPWVALVLAFSFGSYGLAKKKADVGAVESLTVETLVLAPVAAGYLRLARRPGRLDVHHRGRRPRAAARRAPAWSPRSR